MLPEPVPSLPDLPPIAHHGERVLTTELLAAVYGVEPDRIHGNYSENRDRFQEGIHFYRLTGEALKAFKNYPGNSEVVGARAPHLILWTERGAARHAKMLHTDEAWAIFGKLEESYFEPVVAVSATPAVASAVSYRGVVADFKAFASLGPLLGYDTNQAALAANRATRKFHGVDLLSDMGATHLIAPQQAAILTPTDIGKNFDGKSGMAINSLLKLHGFQIGKEDGKGRPYWLPTETGEPFAVWQDTGKRHGDGTPVRQLKWAGTIVDALRAAIDGLFDRPA